MRESPRGEMVDTKDLKSLPARECQFESGRGHHKNEKNILCFR